MLYKTHGQIEKSQTTYCVTKMGNIQCYKKNILWLTQQFVLADCNKAKIYETYIKGLFMCM